MHVLIGNDHAIEAVSGDGAGSAPNRWQPLPGQRVTEVAIPEGVALLPALHTVLAALRYHIEEGHKPAWVVSDSKELQALLLSHFDLPATKGKRPASWGKQDGVAKFLAENPHLQEDT